MNDGESVSKKSGNSSETSGAQLTPPLSLPASVRLLGWASFLNDVASEMVYTQLPNFMLQTLGGNKVWLGVMEGAADTIASFLKLWSGKKSDALRKRKGMIVIGYAMAALTRPLAAFAVAPWQLLGIRIGDRIGKGIRTAPRDALIADVTDKTNRGRAFGFHRGMDHLGAAVGPLLATAFLLLWPDQLRTLFLGSLIPGVAVTILVLWLKEPANQSKGITEPSLDDAAKIDEESSRLLKVNAPFVRYLAAIFLFTLGNASDMFLLVRSTELGVSAAYLPLLWSVFHVAKSGGNMIGGRLVDRIGARRLLVCGWLLYAMVYALFAVATQAWHAWTLFMVYAVHYSLTEPAEKTLVVELVGAAKKGTAFGWFNLILGFGALPASLIFGGLYEWGGPMIAFGFGAALALLSTVLLMTVSTSRTNINDG